MMCARESRLLRKACVTAHGNWMYGADMAANLSSLCCVDIKPATRTNSSLEMNEQIFAQAIIAKLFSSSLYPSSVSIRSG